MAEGNYGIGWRRRAESELRQLAEAGVVRPGDAFADVGHLRLDDELVVYTEVLVGDHVVSPAAVILRLAGDKIIEATAYLTDEETLKTTGRVPRTEAQAGDVPSS